MDERLQLVARRPADEPMAELLGEFGLAPVNSTLFRHGTTPECDLASLDSGSDFDQTCMTAPSPGTTYCVGPEG